MSGHLPVVGTVIGALALSGVASSSALAQPSSATPTGTFLGVVEGRQGPKVALAWRTPAMTVERGNGVETQAPGKTHYVRLGSGGSFTVALPGCQAFQRAFGCAAGTYEVFGTYKRKRCTGTWFINVTAGEAVTMTHAENLEREKNHEEPWLFCK